jgi:hypothetical protein
MHDLDLTIDIPCVFPIVQFKGSHGPFFSGYMCGDGGGGGFVSV